MPGPALALAGWLAASTCAVPLMEHSASVPERGLPEMEVNEDIPLAHKSLGGEKKSKPVSHTHAANYLEVLGALPGEWLRAVYWGA